MSGKWPNVALGELLTHVPRPVDVHPEQVFREIGIRSHGKGIFHKEPVTGLQLGNKRVFWVEPGDFVLNIVFAWEGAVGVVSPKEKGMIGSHRFPTFYVDGSRLEPGFLLAYFKTPNGLDLLGRVSPGGAGRNRTLSRSGFLKQVIPLPPLPEQRRIVARIEGLAAKIEEAHKIHSQEQNEIERLSDAISQDIFSNHRWPMRAIEDFIGCANLQNGKSVKSGEGSDNIMCLRLSSMRNGRIDILDAKPIPLCYSEVRTT